MTGSDAGAPGAGAPRVGLFGGAFDPPHPAHVALARTAIEQLGLTALHVLPTGQAWHKRRVLSADAHRLAMTRLAFEDAPGCEAVVVDDRELRRQGPTYTVDTLTELRAERPGCAWVLQIGADQAAALHTWHRVDELLGMATVSIAVREPTAGRQPLWDMAALRQRWPAASLVQLTLEAMPQSSSEIRRQLAAGVAPTALAAQGWLNEPVARYIAHHHLYTTSPV